MRSMDTDDRGAEPRTSETTPAAASARTTGRHSGALTTAAARRRYWTIMGVLAAAALGIAFGLLAWDNPLPITDEGFWLIAGLRGRSLVVLVIVALCQAFATVAIQTATMYFFGVTALVELRGVLPFTMQLVAMIGLSLALYGWLLSGKYANVEVMLLVGIVIGGGLGAVATFMQRTLTPSEFDVLSARLFGSIANSDATYLPVAIPLCLIACAAIYLSAPRRNVLALGKDVTGNLGLSHRAATITILFFVSILMAVSVSMIGPMIFLGFLVAMLSYQFSDTYDHRYVLPMAGLLGFVILGGAYFILKNIFYAEGVVSIIIEVIGGGVFLFVIMRKGRL